jgi:hypothetical protein
MISYQDHLYGIKDNIATAIVQCAIKAQGIGFTGIISGHLLEYTNRVYSRT